MKRRAATAIKDDELIERIRSDGTSESFSVLYKKYNKKVFDKCYSFVKNRLTARELTNEIFSKTYEQLGSFRQQSSFSSWLFTITYNYCIDYLRKQKQLHYPKWNSENEITDIMDESEEKIDAINYDNLLVILDMIHPEEKAMLLMKYQDNLSIKTIGEAMRISENAAKMRLKRAKTRVMFLYNEKFLKK
jgi:RNA polymerase sigma factor (sigma-70 family)